MINAGHDCPPRSTTSQFVSVVATATSTFSLNCAATEDSRPYSQKLKSFIAAQKYPLVANPLAPAVGTQPIHSHSIVSGTCTHLKEIVFLSGRTEFTVKYTVEKSRLRAIGGDR